MYACMCMYACVCMYVYVYICMYAYVCMHVYECMCMYVCMCMYYACVYMHMYVCMHSHISDCIIYTTCAGTHAKRPRKRARPLATTDGHSVASEILAMTCACKTRCSFVLHTKVADIVDLVKDARETLQKCGHTNSSSFLFNKLLARRELRGAKHVLCFDFGGTRICGDVWCQLHGLRLHDSRIKRVMASLREGAREWASFKSATRRDKKRGWRGAWCEAWMRRHVKKFADFNPGTRTAQLDPDALETRHLLYSIDWVRRAVGSRSGSSVKFSRFNDLWKDICKIGYIEEGVTYQIAIRKPRSGFTCTICQTLIDVRRRAAGQSAKQSIAFELLQHLQQVRAMIPCMTRKHTTHTNTK